MSNYSKTTNFTTKDSLPSGNPSKLVKGSEIDTEFTNIQTAVNSKSDSASPTFSGTITLSSGAAISANSATVTDVELSYIDGVTSSVQTQINTEAATRAASDALLAPLASPTFTGTPAAPTATAGTNTTQIATTAFVISTAFNSALPDQTGNAGKYVTTDGSNASWTTLSNNYTVKTSNYTAVASDRILADTSGGAFTITLPASPSTGDVIYIADSGGAYATYALTVARNGNTIMGLSEDMTITINNASIGLAYNGSTWRLF